MSKPIFLFVTGNLVAGMRFLIQEKLAFRYSAKRSEIRIVLRKLSRLTLVIECLKRLGCKVTRRYDY